MLQLCQVLVGCSSLPLAPPPSLTLICGCTWDKETMSITCHQSSNNPRSCDTGMNHGYVVRQGALKDRVEVFTCTDRRQCIGVGETSEYTDLETARYQNLQQSYPPLLLPR